MVVCHLFEPKLFGFHCNFVPPSFLTSPPFPFCSLACSLSSPIRDFISGAIMAATSVPQLIAYAETAGYSGSRGLSTAGPPLLAWGIITGSPYMNAGVTAMSALMAKSDLNGESFVQEHGEEAYVALVAAYSFYIGIASLVLAVVGFGALAQSVPAPVRTGFKWGCAVGVFVSNVPNGLFHHGSNELKDLVTHSGGLWHTAAVWLKTTVPAATGAQSCVPVFFGLFHPWLWSLRPTILFVVGTWFILQGKHFLPRAAPPGTEVIVATAVATLYSMHFDYPGSIVGDIPELDPEAGISLLGGRIHLPIEVLDLQRILNAPLVDRFGGSYLLLFLSATLFAAVNFLSIMGIASIFENENGIAWSAPRELAAQGISCGVAAWIGSAPVSGSMSRSLVSRMTGTTSALACWITAVLWITLLPYMSIMSPTPKAALSAVVVSAVLQGVVQPNDLLKLQGLDSFVGWGTGILTSITSPTIGFGAGLGLYYGTSVLRRTKEKTA
jgi:MFS superfamily sulfate permease-like transporter